MIPLFKSHYSIGKSILSLGPYEEGKKSDSVGSIVQIAKDNGLEDVTLVEDTMAGVLEAFRNLQKVGINLKFGVRLDVCNQTGDEGSKHKVVIFINKEKGYAKLVNLYSKCKNGHGGLPDYNNLKELWDDSLTLAIPFYDSFIYYNTLTLTKCVPTFFTKPVVLIEDNFVSFDYILQKAVKKFAAQEKLDLVECKSLYYEKEDDFPAWQTFKCMQRLSYGKANTLSSPNLAHCSSNKFSFESWQKKQH